jgi:prophage antirepressor-like protein
MTTTSTKTKNIELTMNTEHPFLIPTTDLELQRVLTATIAPDEETLWFFLDEICEILGLSITSLIDIIERLDLEQEMGVTTNSDPEKEIDSNGDSPKLKSKSVDNDLNTGVSGKSLVISESGLYFLLLHINDPATTKGLLR